MNTTIENFLRQLDMATGELNVELDELETEPTIAELCWQPFEGGHSVGALLTHIAEVEAYWLHHIACGEPYEDIESEVLGGAIDQYAVTWATPPPHPLSHYKALLARVREKTHALIGTLEGPEHTGTRTRRDGTTEEFSLPWLMTHVILHEAYHSGQAILLLLQQRKGAA